MSPGGRAFSRALKEEGKTLLELMPKYARKVLEETPGLMQRYGLKTLDPRSAMFDAARYEQVIEELGHSKEVSTAIIRAAGRTGREVTALARFSRVAGPVGAVCAIAVSLVVVGGSAYAGGALLESGYEALTRKGQGF